MSDILITTPVEKKPREVVTASEWNEILNKIIAQGNGLSTKLTETRNLLDTLIAGGVVNTTVVADMTTFGGKNPEDYVSAERLTIEIANLHAFVQDTVGELLDEVESIKQKMGG